MHIEDRWTDTEERLSREASSLGDLLTRLRGRISPALVGGASWEALSERASDLPATLAAFPFGFELLLHELRPHADLGVSVVSGSRSARHFQNLGSGEDADPAFAGLARLVKEKGRKDSPLHRVTGRKMLLEYDIDPSGDSLHPAPGAFLYPTEQPLYGRDAGRRLDDLGIVLDGVAATGWNWDACERRQVERLFLALQPEARILSLGAFPCRARGIRLAVTGFKTSGEVMTFLQRAGWRWPHARLESTLAHLKARDSFGTIAVHLDVRSDGLGPKLGLGLYARDIAWLQGGRYWLDAPSNWTAFIESMREERLAVPEKLAALENWSSGAELLFGSSGRFVLVRGVHHVKLVLAEDRVDQVKAYVFLLMCSPMQIGQTPDELP